MMSNKALQLNEQWANEAKDQLAYSLHQCGSDMTVTIDTIGIDIMVFKVSDNTMSINVPMSIESLANNRVSFGQLAMAILRVRQDALTKLDDVMWVK